MEQIDLKLVPIQELINEIMIRSITCVIGYTTIQDPGAPNILMNYKSDASWIEAVGLCDAIKDEIFNNRREKGEDG